MFIVQLVVFGGIQEWKSASVVGSGVLEVYE
jgi:hypothetical protein